VLVAVVTDQQPASSPPAPSLTERTLSRLRRLAAGNGLEPADIAILEAKEQTFVLIGKMEISPLCETQATSYPGGIRGKDRKPVPSFAALQTAIAKHQQQFNESPDWVAETTRELGAYENSGWGLEDAKVILPQKSTIYAATETCPTCGGRQILTCPQCSGRTTVTCTQCQGRGRETCYYCGGRGENPYQPTQPCPTCNGTRFVPCRFCQSRGTLSCPTCKGRGGTPCSACHSSGRLTQEVTVTCGAETHFTFKAEGLPSGLRRGLDRIGISNLGKGHADIRTSAPTKEEKEQPLKGNRILALHYHATLPFAELRMGLGSRKAIVSAVGKRCALVDVPAFLDEPLKPWRDLTEVRKLYPFGLSSEVIMSLLTDTQLALKKTTLKTRAALALISYIASIGLFYKLYGTGLLAWTTMGWSRWTGFAADMAVLALTLGISWVILSFSTCFVLRRRFPQCSPALRQKTGKIGLAMMSGIALTFALFIRLSPLAPAWLVALLVR